ncbi:MAG: hypothetical protein ACPG85_07320, partial [Flavobacteriales bacterium]
NIHRKSDARQKAQSRVSSFVQQHIAGIRVLKSFNRERDAAERFDDETAAYKVRVLDLVKDAWRDIVVLGNEPPPDESRQAWDYLLARPRRKQPVTLDRTTEPQLAEDVMEYVRGHQQDSAWQKTKKALRVGILDACTQRGTEALEVEVLDKVYRVKVTATGRFYPKLITTKGEK